MIQTCNKIQAGVILEIQFLYLIFLKVRHVIAIHRVSYHNGICQ